MMKIGVDLRPLQPGFKAHLTRGIGSYSKGLIGELADLDRDGLLVGYSDPGFGDPVVSLPVRKSFDGFGGGPVKPLIQKKMALGQHLFFRFPLARAYRREGLNRFFFLSHLDVPAGFHLPYTAVVHDLLQFALDFTYDSVRDRVMKRFSLNTIRNAASLIAVSKNTREDVVKYARVPPEKIAVIPEGVDPRFFLPPRPEERSILKEKYGVSPPYVLHVGGVERRKNVHTLLEVFFKVGYRYEGVKLVVAGKIKDDPNYPYFERQVQFRKLWDRLVLPGYIDGEDLPALYRNAEAMFYPTLYEGFGIPVAEALACGTPVVTSAVSSLPEIAGDAALLCHPYSVEQFEVNLIKALRDPRLRKDLSEKGMLRSRRFVWRPIAEAVLDHLRSTSNPRPG
jgi:glycosyltransferase involved in cell wall biosynthesis